MQHQCIQHLYMQHQCIRHLYMPWHLYLQHQFKQQKFTNLYDIYTFNNNPCNMDSIHWIPIYTTYIINECNKKFTDLYGIYTCNTNLVYDIFTCNTNLYDIYTCNINLCNNNSPITISRKKFHFLFESTLVVHNAKNVLLTSVSHIVNGLKAFWPFQSNDRLNGKQNKLFN